MLLGLEGVEAVEVDYGGASPYRAGSRYARSGDDRTLKRGITE